MSGGQHNYSRLRPVAAWWAEEINASSRRSNQLLKDSRALQITQREQEGGGGVLMCSGQQTGVQNTLGGGGAEPQSTTESVPLQHSR